jgi:hypothetical protein
VEVTARIGWTARGVLYAVVAILVSQVASSGGSKGRADQQGAFATLADRPFGKVLLLVVAGGLLAFAVFRAWAAIRGGDEKTNRRLGWGISAVVYAYLATLAIGVLRNGAKSGNEKQALTARVLDWPGGPIIVGIAGLVVIGVAANYFRKGVKERFLHDIDEGAVPDRFHTAVRAVGMAGWLGRSLAWTLVGFFVLRAAWQHDPNEPVGLDQTLHKLAGESWGPPVLWVACAGLAAYALLCFATAAWPDQDPDG